MHEVRLGLEQVRANGDLDVQAVRVLLREQRARRVEERRQVVGAVVAGAADAVAADAHTHRLLPFDRRVGEELGAGRGDGDGQVAETRARGKQVADVEVVLGRLDGLEAVLDERDELEELQRSLRCRDEGGDTLGGDAGHVGDQDLLEVGGRAGHEEQVLVADGLQVGVAKDLESAELAEVEAGGLSEHLGVPVALGELADLALEADGEELERGQPGEGEDVVPIGRVAVPERGPGDGRGAHVAAVLEDLEDVADGVVAVDAVEPDPADVAGELRVVAEQLGGRPDRLVRVLVDDGQDLDGERILERAAHPGLSSLPPADVQFPQRVRQRPLVPLCIHLSDRLHRVPPLHVRRHAAAKILLGAGLVLHGTGGLREAVGVRGGVDVVGVQLGGDREDLRDELERKVLERRHGCCGGSPDDVCSEQEGAVPMIDGRPRKLLGGIDMEALD